MQSHDVWDTYMLELYRETPQTPHSWTRYQGGHENDPENAQENNEPPTYSRQEKVSDIISTYLDS